MIFLQGNFYSSLIGNKNNITFSKINLPVYLDVISCQNLSVCLASLCRCQSIDGPSSIKRALCLGQLRKSVLVKTLVNLVIKKAFFLKLLLSTCHSEWATVCKKEVSQLRPKSDDQHSEHITRVVAADWQRALRKTYLAHSPLAA